MRLGALNRFRVKSRAELVFQKAVGYLRMKGLRVRLCAARLNQNRQTLL